jgi:hypothetical protein
MATWLASNRKDDIVSKEWEKRVARIFGTHVQGVRLHHAIFAAKQEIVFSIGVHMDKNVLLKTVMLQPLDPLNVGWKE